MDDDVGTLQLCRQRRGLPHHWGIAAQVAIGAGGAVTDQKGVLHTIIEQPFGHLLLSIVAVGLLG